MGLYLHKHDHAFPQNLIDKHFVIVVTLEDLLFQKLARCQMEGFSRSVEPAAVEPPLPFTQKARVTNYKVLNTRCVKHIIVFGQFKVLEETKTFILTCTL